MKFREPTLGERFSEDRFIQLFPYIVPFFDMTTEEESSDTFSKIFGERMRADTGNSWVVVNPDARWDFCNDFGIRTAEDAALIKIMFPIADVRKCTRWDIATMSWR